MAIRKVLQVPSSVLATPCEAVVEFDERLDSLVVDLLDTMAASPACVGLAANQIGVAMRVFAVDVTGHPKADICHGAVVIVNPQIVEQDGVTLAREGCMSVPDLTGNVRRAETLTIAGFDPSGNSLRITTNAFEARAMQHELDHIDGKVFIDRVDSFAADVFRRQRYSTPRNAR